MSNYVQFFRGTPQAYANAVKNKDTLYFVSESDKDEGKLYLGTKLISDTINSVSELNDVVLTNLADKHLMSYDEASQKWINKSIVDAIGLMVGAKNGKQGANGLVPAPGIGDEKLFLRGDGVWATPESNSSNIDYAVDGRSVTTLDDGITLTLKDFGKKYYKFVAVSGNIEAHYEAQIVDANNPWTEGLEPKVVNDNGELILGWFEKDTSLNNVVEVLTNDVNSLKSKVKVNQGSIASLQASVAGLNSVLSQKANAADVYTKDETNFAIEQAVTSASHLKRKTFETLEEAQAFAESASNADQYIYMVQSEFFILDDKYDEYLYIDGALEKVGSWETDLSDYVTKAEIEETNLKVNNLESLLNNKADKSEVTEVKNNVSQLNNKVTTLEELLNNKADKTEVENVKTKVSSLEELLNNKADKSEVENIKNNTSNLADSILTLDTKVNDLEAFLNSEYFVTSEQYKSDLAEIRDIVTWKDL